jgi:hypothetical protein
LNKKKTSILEDKQCEVFCVIIQILKAKFEYVKLEGAVATAHKDLTRQSCTRSGAI